MDQTPRIAIFGVLWWYVTTQLHGAACGFAAVALFVILRRSSGEGLNRQNLIIPTDGRHKNGTPARHTALSQRSSSKKIAAAKAARLLVAHKTTRCQLLTALCYEYCNGAKGLIPLKATIISSLHRRSCCGRWFGMYRQNSTNVHSGTERPSQDKFDRFEAWLKENGAQFDLVSRVVIDRTCRFFACFLSRRWGVRHLHERFCVEEMSCKIVKHRTAGLARAKVQHMEYIASCNNH